MKGTPKKRSFPKTPKTGVARSKKRRKRVTPTSEKRAYLDGVWGEAVRLLWNGLCGVCGKGGSQPHHFFGKAAHPSVRFEPDNGIWMCFYCHIRRIHTRGETEVARDALIAKVGQGRFDILKAKAHKGGKTLTLAALDAIEVSLLTLINDLRTERR